MKVIALIMVLFIFFIFYDKIEEKFEVKGNSIKEIKIRLNEKDVFSGDFSVEGGFTSEIYFYVKDPIGNKIIDKGMVIKGTHVGFTAKINGIYTFVFNNTHSKFSKFIFFYYEIKKDLKEVPTLKETIFFIVIIIMIVPLILFTLKMLKIKKKKKENNHENLNKF